MTFHPPEQAAAVIPIDKGGFAPARRTVAEIQTVRAQVIELMKSAMQEGVHFGKIPGTPKPTLYKAGAEMLLSMFHLSDRIVSIDDLSTYDEIRYRVRVEVSGPTRTSESAGVCSSSERKYRWRAPVCNEEFDETPAERRREVWIRADGGAKKIHQVRTDPADAEQTILSMAFKRGLIGATRLALAVSDVFQQDIDDMPEEWSHHLTASDGETIAEEPKQEPQPVAKGEAPTHLHVTNVRVVKTGKNDRGPWTKWGVKFSDGKEAYTFNDAVKKTADALKSSCAAIDLDVEHGDYGDNITTLREKK
jgi:hypothetical protein